MTKNHEDALKLIAKGQNLIANEERRDGAMCFLNALDLLDTTDTALVEILPTVAEFLVDEGSTARFEALLTDYGKLMESPETPAKSRAWFAVQVGRFYSRSNNMVAGPNMAVASLKRAITTFREVDAEQEAINAETLLAAVYHRAGMDKEAAEMCKAIRLNTRSPHRNLPLMVLWSEVDRALGEEKHRSLLIGQAVDTLRSILSEQNFTALACLLTVAPEEVRKCLMMTPEKFPASMRV